MVTSSFRISFHGEFDYLELFPWWLWLFGKVSIVVFINSRLQKTCSPKSPSHKYVYYFHWCSCLFCEATWSFLELCYTCAVYNIFLIYLFYKILIKYCVLYIHMIVKRVSESTVFVILSIHHQCLRPGVA